MPFPSEAEDLLRAAFRDKPCIVVRFPKQGFSESLVFSIQPLDSSDRKTGISFLAKLYSNDEKARTERYNCQHHVVAYMNPRYYPKYDDVRRCRGRAFSLLVTNLIEGPDGQVTSFKDIVEADSFSVQQVEEFIDTTLLILDQSWNGTMQLAPVDLVWEYLRKSLDEESRERKLLEAENVSHRWFGICLEKGNLESNIRSFLPTHGTRARICHGDFHADNLMVEDIKGTLVPVFIDFSRTGPKHSVMDLVTLESDLIIRSLEGTDIGPFLRSVDDITDEIGTPREKPIGIQGSHRTRKIGTVIRRLRHNAISVHGVSISEYERAALLKTLEVLSYGKLPFYQNERATQHVTHLCSRVRLAS